MRGLATPGAVVILRSLQPILDTAKESVLILWLPHRPARQAGEDSSEALHVEPVLHRCSTIVATWPGEGVGSKRLLTNNANTAVCFRPVPIDLSITICDDIVFH